MPAIQSLLDVAAMAKFDDRKLQKLFVETLKSLDDDLIDGEYVSSDEMDANIIALQERYDDLLAEASEKEDATEATAGLEVAEEASEDELQETLDEVEEDAEDELEDDEVTR